MSLFENRRFSKVFLSFRDKSPKVMNERVSKVSNFSRKMSLSLKVKSSSNPMLRKLSFRAKSSSKRSRCDLSGHQWKSNPLYVSSDQVIWKYNTTYSVPRGGVGEQEMFDADISHSELAKQTFSSSGVSSGSSDEAEDIKSGIDLVKQPSQSSGMSTDSSGMYSVVSTYGSASNGSSSKVFSAEPEESYLVFESPSQTTIGIPITPTIPTTSAKLRLVKGRIDGDTKSDADFDIHIDEYYTQDSSELLSESSSGISSGVSSDDEISPENYYQNFCDDLVDDIRTFIKFETQKYTDCTTIVILENSH